LNIYNISTMQLLLFVANKIDNVNQFSHLGHIIPSFLLDGDVQRRNTLVRQTNNIVCFLNKLNIMVISWNCLSLSTLAYMGQNFVL